MHINVALEKQVYECLVSFPLPLSIHLKTRIFGKTLFPGYVFIPHIFDTAEGDHIPTAE